MFQKPFRVKANSVIKSSNRKKLRSDILEKFPNLSSADVEDFVSSKDEMSLMKLETHSGETVTVYCKQKNPIFFETQNTFYPTVYALWKCPHIIKSFRTWQQVLKRLCNGADLMMPGIVVTDKKYGPNSFGNLEKGEPCFVNLVENEAAVAVGKAALSSRDMYESGKHGKGVIILHTCQDLLWALGDKTVLPQIEPKIEQKSSLVQSDDSVIVGKNAEEAASEHLANTEEGTVTLQEALDKVDLYSHEDTNEEPTGNPMDQLLLYCFLKAWRTSAKKVELPILVSNFYRLHMIQACPANLTLDVKKSTYKKLSKFLQEMQLRGIVVAKELTKGVESVVEVNYAHAELKSFVVDPNDAVASVETVEENKLGAKKYEPPFIEDLHVVTADVLPLFKVAGHGKGSALSANEVRRIANDYVRKNNLQDPDKKSIVRLDPQLTSILLKRSENVEILTWESMYSRLFAKMKPAYKLTLKGSDPVIKKGKPEPIEITISQRAANKQVTLINNLETFGIDPHSLAHTLQIGVAASASVNPVPNKKEGMQVLVQGNQVLFLAKLLLDEYKIPLKFIRGLENAPKKKKK